LPGLPAAAPGGVLVVAAAGIEAAVQDVGKPPSARAVIVFRLGPRFPAAPVSVCR